MTDSPDTTPARGTRTVVTLLVVTAVLLLPLVVGLGYAAHDAIENKSDFDWRANHEARRSLENAAVLICGAPSFGAGLFWMVGTALGRRPGVSAATGALLGTLGLWVGGVVAFCLALRNATFVM
ncbi:hypothetical protein [Streptomyces sp. S.PNR 29]|uniref:hypothetical protein n=1 Tax=Streptomyces sp. S.PNR 29 TaxID=2973805 RepID=UPI0025B164F0|nr:hypothetical protein [Streptomyces sp. S.PNR 29]MDN0198622.1 hypothetical protein [Streptomyces sp. S.PNR 29]